MVPHRGLLIAVVALAALLAACSGGDEKTPAGTGGSTATGAASATSGGGDSTNETELAVAGPELSAYHLLDSAGYAAALNEPVSAVEDDGVVPDASGCEIGQARALTAAGVLITTTLHTADSTDDAKQAYSSLGNFGSIPSTLAGVGDQSAYTDSFALVQKGAQVLRVTSGIAPGIDPKANGADPTAALAAAAAAAGRAAPALAEKMSGQPCNGPALGIPAGAIQPCATKASDIESALGISGVTARPVLSDRPATQECQYDLGQHAGTVTVYSRTDDQLRFSIVPTSAADAYANELASATNERNAANAAQSFESEQFKGFGYTASGARSAGMNEELLYTKAISEAVYHPVASGKPSVSAIILTILESTSDVKLIRPEDCKELIGLLLDDAFQQFNTDLTVIQTLNEYDNAEAKLTAYCEEAVFRAQNP